MAYTRKIYDSEAYKKELQESTQPGRYSLLEDSTFSNQTCFQETPEMHSGLGQYRISENNDMVNAESDLFNLNRKDSKDPHKQYPYVKPSYNKQPKLEKCDQTDLARKYPLLEAPVHKREQQIHVQRFDSLCLNPQDMSRIRANSYIGLNSRLFFRDNHKNKKPVLMSEDKSLPTPSEWISPLDQFFAKVDVPKKQEEKQEEKQVSKKENFTVGGSCGCA